MKSAGWVHRIVEKDVLNASGICSNCGPVRLRKKGNTWVCRVGDLARKQKANEARRYGGPVKRPPECEVCHKVCKTFYDHNHDTGEFRGWLCSSCNLALGYVYDNPEILRSLADYIDRNSDEY